MLNLNTRVHLDEDVLTSTFTCGINEELYGSCVLVANGASESHSIAVQSCTQLVRDVGSGSNLHNLLVATLNRAVTLEQVNGFALAVGKNLNFNVTWTQDSLLEEHTAIAESAFCFTHGGFEGWTKLVHCLHAAHTASTTTGNSFSEDGKTNFSSFCQKVVNISGGLSGLEHRNTRCDGVVLRGDLISGHFQYAGRRTNEGDAVVCCCLG